MFTYFYNRAFSAVNYRLARTASGRWGRHCRPVSIGFMLTNLCNAHCVHCDIWHNKGKVIGPTLEGWKQVADDLRSWLGPVWIYFSGGEALLVPFASELIAHASRRGLLVEVLTHGYWPDQSRIEALALARPARVTISLDGIGEVHTKIRGRERFFDKTMTSILTLQRLRRERNLKFTIRLKHVIMAQNLDETLKVVEFANQPGVEIFFQPIEQNYNTPADPQWFEKTPNWPKDADKAIANVRKLIALKHEGLPIANSFRQLEAMIPYFRNPAATQLVVKMHAAHEKHPTCPALLNLQFMPNGDVITCFSKPAEGNIMNTPIRRIWESRDISDHKGCCGFEEREQARDSDESLVHLGA